MSRLPARCIGYFIWLFLGSISGWSQSNPSLSSPPRPAVEPGLETAFVRLGPGAHETDRIILPTVALAVPRGQSPTPFLAPGKFQAVFTGWIDSELRGEYAFEAELNGALSVAINGNEIFQVPADNPPGRRSAPVKLNKGTNQFTAIYTSPDAGDAMLRLAWVPKGGLASPLPAAALSHSASREFDDDAQRAFGRDLFLEFRCAKCHLPDSATPPASDMDAPTFEEIGSRQNATWLAPWISDPKVLRPDARMPQLFHVDAREQAEAAAAFLSSLTVHNENQANQITLSGSAVRGPTNPPLGNAVENGKRLFDDLHCAACHDVPGSGAHDPQRVSLRNVTRKFLDLRAYLLRPEQHYAWTRMPNFQLSDAEANSLASYLEATAEKNLQSAPAPPTPETIARGRSIIQNSGCLNCHRLTLENRFTAKPLSDLPASGWQGGCLALEPAQGSKAPFFGLTAMERRALQRFAASDRNSLGRSAPMASAPGWLRELKCAECHGKFDGFPPLERLGGKLRPEWMRAFIAGAIPYRPRAWLAARMPAFPAYAAELAAGLGMIHGDPPQTAPLPWSDPEMAKIGQKLVSAEGGLSCISCHSVGKVSATQVFENAGINFAYSSARLLKRYYQRWVRNPLAIDPVSKMPMFFDEELHSVLADVYDGDGAKQIEAIWQYLLLGDKMPPPPGTEPAP